MDSFLNKVTNIDDYRAITQDLETKYRSQDVAFNMSSILCLIKLQSLEVEYFTKSHENGAAFRILQRILRHPPSKTWGDLLGTKLVDLLQFWLDAVRYHLINRHIHWWLFLQQLLGFAKELSTKDNNGKNKIANCITEQLSPIFVELATHGKASPEQTHEIISTLNECCSSSSREVRLAVKTNFEKHFTNLSHMLAVCGYFPLQYSGLETLMRFLVPRTDMALRATMRNIWFPTNLYKQSAIHIYLKRPWMDFFKDARDFLMAQNAGGEYVITVQCYKITVGPESLINGTEKYPNYVDLSRGSRSLTALVPAAQRSNTCDWFLVAYDNVESVALLRNQRDEELMILITTYSSPGLYPSSNSIFEGSKTVQITVNFADLDKVNQALEVVFGDKYQYNPDIPRCSTEKRRPSSGMAVLPKSSMSPSSISTTSLVQLPEKLAALPPFDFNSRAVKRNIIVPPDLSCVTEGSETEEIPHSLGSNSTLIIQPFKSGMYNYQSHMEAQKEEKSHSDDSANAKRIADEEKPGSQSDGDMWKKPSTYKYKRPGMSSLLAVAMKAADRNYLEKSLENFPEDLDLSSDNLTEMLIQESFRSRNGDQKDDQQMHVQEAVRSRDDDQGDDSGINTEKNTQEDIPDVVENTPYEDFESSVIGRKAIAPSESNPKKASKPSSVKASTSDESNTSAINDTPMAYVNVRRGNLGKIRKQSPSGDRTSEVDEHEAAAVDDFFSQHKDPGPSVSPSHARQINETSSDSDDGLEANLNSSSRQFNISVEQLNLHADVLTCVSNMLDKVSELKVLVVEKISPKAAETEKSKCKDVELLEHNTNIEKPKAQTKKTKVKDVEPLENITNLDISKAQTEKTEGKDVEPLQNTTNTVNPKKKPTKANKKKAAKEPTQTKLRREKDAKTVNKNKLELASAQSPPDQTCGETSDVLNKKSTSDRKSETPRMVRKKRKLYSYSPTATNIHSDESDANDQENKNPSKVLRKIESDTDESQSDDDEPLIGIKERQASKSKTPQSRASCYIDDDEPLIGFKEKQASKPKIPQSRASCYIEIEKDRKIFRSRSRKTSDEDNKFTKQQNELFDSLKNNIEGTEKVVLVDKRSKSVYNFTSDSSDDEAFKKKETEIKKRCLARAPESSDVKGKQVSSKDNIVSDKRKPPARRGRNPKIERKVDDEKMRTKPTEELNTSFVFEKEQCEHSKDLNPNIIAPQIVEEDQNVSLKPVVTAEGKKPAIKKNVIKTDKIEQVKTARLDTKRPRKERAKTPKPESNKSKLDVIKNDDDGTVSPLPALEVETVDSKNQDANDSVVTSILAKKITKMYQNPEDVDDGNDTQNLLLETDHNSSLDPVMCFPEEIDLQLGNKNDVVCGNPVTGTQLKIKGYSDISDVEKENNRGNTDIDSQKTALNSGSAIKKKNLKLKKKPVMKEAFIAMKREDISAATKVQSAKSNSVSPPTKDITINYCVETTKSRRVNKRKVLETHVIHKSVTNLIEEIDLTAIDDEAEKSISSNGITGHGDSEEAPPNSKELNEKFDPRYLDDSDSGRELRETYARILNDDTTPKSDNARVVLEKLTPVDIERLSRANSSVNDSPNDDMPISAYLPSRRDSETSQESRTAEDKKQPEIAVNAAKRTVKDNTTDSMPSKTGQDKNTSKTVSPVLHEKPIADSKTPKSGQTKTFPNDTKVKRISQISPMSSLCSTLKRNIRPISEDEIRNSASKNDTGSESCHTRKEIYNEVVTEKSKQKAAITKTKQLELAKKIVAKKRTSENVEILDLTESDCDESDVSSNTSVVNDNSKKTAKHVSEPSGPDSKVAECVGPPIIIENDEDYGSSESHVHAKKRYQRNRDAPKNTPVKDSTHQKKAPQLQNISTSPDFTGAPKNTPVKAPQIQNISTSPDVTGGLSPTSKGIIDHLLGKSPSPKPNLWGQSRIPNSNIPNKRQVTTQKTSDCPGKPRIVGPNPSIPGNPGTLRFSPNCNILGRGGVTTSSNPLDKPRISPNRNIPRKVRVVPANSNSPEQSQFIQNAKFIAKRPVNSPNMTARSKSPTTRNSTSSYKSLIITPTSVKTSTPKKDIHEPFKRPSPMPNMMPKRLKLDLQNFGTSMTSVSSKSVNKRSEHEEDTPEVIFVSRTPPRPNAEPKRPKVVPVGATTSTASVESWLKDSQDKEKEITAISELEDIVKILLEHIETTRAERLRESRQSLLRLLREHVKKFSESTVQLETIEKQLRDYKQTLEELMKSLNSNALEHLRVDQQKDLEESALLTEEVISLLNRAKARL